MCCVIGFIYNRYLVSDIAKDCFCLYIHCYILYYCQKKALNVHDGWIYIGDVAA